ncbi:MAG: ABC transporter substrate-binding protein [Candidatus Cloacimonetes bacterium]|nr:ABC transporter substrate-binding protein [Candidatus Cloacimonadota bacterium]
MVLKVRFVLLLLLLLGLTGCQKVPQNEYDAQGRLKITFWHAMGGELGSVLKSMIADYNKSQDKVFVHPEFMGRYDILEQKIIASVMAGKTPDLAQMYESVTLFLTRDKGEESLLDLTPLTKEWDGFEDLYDVFKRNSIYDGKVYSIPFNKSFPVIYFNQDVLDLLGEKQSPGTWSELGRVAKDCYEKVVVDKATSQMRLRTPEDNDNNSNRVYGFAFPIDPWVYQIAYLQLGGKNISEDEKEVYYDSQEALDAMDFWIRAIVEGWGYRSEGYNFQNDFGARKVAFIITSVVSRRFMEPKLNFPFTVAPVPLEEKRKVSVMSGTNVCIFSGLTPERTKAAWDFLKWFSEAERTAEWSERTFYVPIRKQALATDRMQEFVKNVKGADAAIVQLPYGDMEPRSSAWYRCRIILREHMERIVAAAEKEPDLIKARKIAKELLAEANQKMNKVLQKYAQ